MNILLKKIKYIFEGYFKYIKDLIYNTSTYKSRNRYNICKQCEFNNHGICEKCGCIIKVKVKVDFLEDENGISLDGCPERKW
jgi:hypothetical protein